MIATLLAGYPAPAIFGLVAAWVLSQGTPSRCCGAACWCWR